MGQIGTLHVPVDPWKGKVQSFIRTLVCDLLYPLMRGKLRERVHEGDIVIVEDLETSSVGPYTPLAGGEFIGYHTEKAGIHGYEDLYFNFARQVVTEVQGRCPRALAKVWAGPQFEGPHDEWISKLLGQDVEGMVGLIQELFVAILRGIPVVQLVCATDGAFALEHSHLKIIEAGRRNAPRATETFKRLVTRWPEKPTP